MSMVAPAILSYRMYRYDPYQLSVFIAVLVAALIIEYMYRLLTERRISIPFSSLAEREKFIMESRSWIPRVVNEIAKIAKTKIHLVGGIARDEIEGSVDINITVIPRKAAEEEARKREKTAIKGPERRLHLPHWHTLHIHVVHPRKGP